MNSRTLLVLALAIPASILSMAAGAEQDDVTLPEGDGKALVARTCTKCHGLEMFAGARKSGHEWVLILEKMNEEGLEMEEDDAASVLNYLSKYLGKEAAPAKVNVNKAGAKELEQSLGLLDTEAEAIIKHRTEHGSFKDWRELTKVEGVDAKKIEARKEQIEL